MPATLGNDSVIVAAQHDPVPQHAAGGVVPEEAEQAAVQHHPHPQAAERPHRCHQG